jgi:membrane protein
MSDALFEHRPRSMHSVLRLGRRVRDRVLSLPGVAHSVRTVLVVAAGLRDEPITLRAGQLTYLTVLSLVPLLAVIFSIFQAVLGLFHAIPGAQDLQQQMQDFIYDNLGVGSKETFQRFLSQYVARAGAIGGVGAVFLFASAVSLMWNVEAAFNHIFRATRPRTLALRFGVYWCLLTLGPILLALSIAATAMLARARVDVEWVGHLRSVSLVVGPFFVTSAAFMLLYLIVPSVPVQRRAALVGALIAGFSWEVAKYVYAAISAASVRNSAIYGSLSAIPIFMLWVYVSWIIVLFGARVTYAAQERHAELSADLVKRPLGRELLVARAMLSVARPFAHRRPPPTSRLVAYELRTTEAETRAVLEELRDAGLVRHVDGGGWVPARPLESIALRDVRSAARGSLSHKELFEPLLAALSRRWLAADDVAGSVLDVSLAAVVESETSGTLTDPGGLPTVGDGEVS